MPLIGLHVANPPEGGWEHPGYMIYQQDAEAVINRHHDTTIHNAHMFWLCCNDEALDVYDTFLERNPNLYADVSATEPYLRSPPPTHTKLRDFMIKWKDRFMFGTDGTPFQEAFSMWESTNNGGLGLPLIVLNHLYYWNAAQVIPGVKERLIAMGYEISDYPPE